MREVSNEEGKSLANDLNIKFFEVSAKTGGGVYDLLDDIVNSLIKTFEKSNKTKIDLNKYLNY